MCTVTYIPSADGCYLTSSRDEHAARPGAIAPAVYQHNGTVLLYPKDAKANGSWIAFTQTGNAAVLLNGAFVKHIVKPSYRKSRGLIFLDIIAHPQPEFCFMGKNLEGIEPFTIILFLQGCLFEGRWDGAEKHFVQLDESCAHIWSSATLYSPEMTGRRKQWFERWLTETDSPTKASIFNFHRFAGDGDHTNSIFMNRDSQLFTVSITCIAMNAEEASMQYFDAKHNCTTQHSLSFETVNR